MLEDGPLCPFQRRAYAMGMPAPVRWTRQSVLDLPPDGHRYELIDGQLVVSPAPRLRHQLGITLLFRLLDAYVLVHRLGLAMPVAADLELEPGQLTQPDLFILPPGPYPPRWEEAPSPLLVVEILSPSTARHDRGIKRHFYQRAGIPEYWVVDLDGRVVERWRPGAARPEVMERSLSWQPDASVPALVLNLEEYFTQVAELVPPGQ